MVGNFLSRSQLCVKGGAEGAGGNNVGPHFYQQKDVTSLSTSGLSTESVAVGTICLALLSTGRAGRLLLVHGPASPGPEGEQDPGQYALEKPVSTL